MALEIAVAARTNRRERIASPRGLDRHVLDGLLDRLGVVDDPHLHRAQAAESTLPSSARCGLNFDRSDPVLLAFLDREGDHESASARIVFRSAATI